jgi:hypothetical protein
MKRPDKISVALLGFGWVLSVGMGCGKTSTGVGNSGCPEVPNVNRGATSGTLTIRGHLKDANGAAVVGSRVELVGGGGAIRFSDVTGGFTFRVPPGTYSLHPSSTCKIRPSAIDTGALVANASYDFTVEDAGCVTSVASNVIGAGSVHTVTQRGLTLGMTFVTIEEKASAGEATARLQEIVREQQAAHCDLTIDGNAAVERQIVLMQPGPQGGPGTSITSLTTAIAVGTTVVRFESRLPADAVSDVVHEFVAFARNFTIEELPDLHSSIP